MSSVLNRLIVSLVLTATTAACSESDQPDAPTTYPAAPAVCPGGPERPEIRVFPRIAQPGANPNVIRAVGNGEFAIVESFANTISILDADGNLRPFADLGNDKNPYDITRSGDTFWVTNYLAQTVSVLNASTGAVIDEVTAQSLDDPSGVGRLGDTVYITNVAYTGPNRPYGDGSVTAFDAQTRRTLGQLDVAAKNPVFARPLDLGGQEALVVVSAGEIELTDEGAGVSSPGAVEVWRQTDQPLAPDRATFAMPQVDNRRIGAPGRPLPAPDGRLYFASATAPVLFVLDPEGGWVHGTDDPLFFSDQAGDSLHHADIDSSGIAYVTSFNEDALYLWDTSCDALLAGPIDLGESSFLEGPHGIVVVETPGSRPSHAFFITNALAGSEAVGRVEFDWAD